MRFRLTITGLTAASLFLAAGCGLFHRHHAPQPPYWVTDLGPLPGGKTSQVFDLNDNGVAVGRADYGGSRGHQHAVEWESGKAPRDLDGHAGQGSEADKISPGGKIVGWASTSSKDKVGACLFSDAGAQFFFRHGESMSLAFGVGDDGIIGVTFDQPGGTIGSALTGDDTAAGNLGALPGFRDTTATSMSSGGTVVGIAGNGCGRKQAFEWSKSGLVGLTSPAGFTNSFANDISPAGNIAGSCSTGPTHFRAVLWRNGQPTALSTPNGKDSEAYAVDDAGVVVGECNNHACLWRNGKLIDLNNMIGKHGKTVLNKAIAINRTGEIACNGMVNKEIHAFLLVPSSSRS